MVAPIRGGQWCIRTRVSILGPKLFRHDTWRVRINGEKWLYDHNLDCFIARDRHVVDRVDMPLLVVIAFHLAWCLSGCFPLDFIPWVPMPAEHSKPCGRPQIMYDNEKYHGVITFPLWEDGPDFEVSACRGWRKRKL